MDVRNASDRAMAERIAATTCWPKDARAKRAAIEAMLKPLVERALRMCREAREAGLRSDDAAEKFVSAELEGGYWLKPLKDASDYWAMASARRLIGAYAAAEVALGADGRLGSRCGGTSGVRSMFGKRRRRFSSVRRAVSASRRPLTRRRRRMPSVGLSGGGAGKSRSTK